MAQFTNLDLAGAARILDHYGLVPQSVRSINGGLANSSYLVVTEAGDELVVTICDRHDHMSARRLLHVIEAVQDTPFAPPAPLRTVDSHADGLVTFEGKPTIVKPYVVGRCGHRLGDDELATLGSVLAAIHLLDPPLPLHSHDRRLKPDWLAGPGATEAEVVDAANSISKLMSGSFVKALPSGFTHGDLFSDNIIWTGEPVPTVIDWESASVDYFVYDLAIALLANCVDDQGVDPDRCMTVIDGYQTLRRLTGIETKLLDSCAQYAAGFIAMSRSRRRILYPELVVPDYSHMIQVAWDGLRLPKLAAA